jgi:hypothetical protein
MRRNCLSSGMIQSTLDIMQAVPFNGTLPLSHSLLTLRM